MSNFKNQIVIKNSPVEFVISSPRGGLDRIIVRSENVGLELIGRTVLLDLEPKISQTIYDRIKGGLRLNTFVTGPVSDMHPDIDHRFSSMIFTWRGFAPEVRLLRFKSEVDGLLRNIYDAYLNDDHDGVELHVSAVIYYCSTADRLYLRSQRGLKVLLAAYAATFVASMVWFILSRNLVVF